MAAETITVYIDKKQLKAQKDNKYSLYLAKKVSGQFTVIWQSRGPIATVGNPSYEYKNIFQIQVPNYEVNYGNVETTEGSVTFDASGQALTIAIGQKVKLDQNGIFGDPTNDGTAGDIIIDNHLAANPHAILLDNEGNPIFVNVQSGMDIGTATLTPIDTYQIWFDNYQQTGTIIAHNVSNPATVIFDGGTADKVISYNASGAWQTGPLSQSLDLAATGLGQDVDSFSVAVLATFRYALTAGAVTYLMKNLIGKFGNLHPTKISAAIGGLTMTVDFGGQRVREILTAYGTTKYETAVNNALRQAKADKKSDLQDETWTVSEGTVTASY